MAEGGYVLIYRRLLDNPVFRSDAEAMAFAWMVIRAQWKASTVRYKGRLLDLERGQFAMSVRDIAGRLEWSKDRVSRFLNTLANRDMIATASETGVNIVTICKYDEYQLDPEGSATAAGHQPRQDRDRTATQNNKGNELNEENEEKVNPSGDGQPYHFDGRVVRLTEMDFRRWEKSFPDLDLRAVLQSRDDWLATEADDKTRTKWFVATSNYLSTLQRRAADERKSAGAFQI